MSVRPIIYFASDFHLGAPSKQASREREALLVSWLDVIRKDADEIYLLGDVFDFWFEYKTVVPKGYVRLLGKLAELTDSGIKVSIFTGNHDMWMFDYLEEEIGVEIIRKPVIKTFGDKVFYLGHGDGLGPGDYQYKILKKVFSNSFCQWLFARIHPNLSFGIANFWSKKSRVSNHQKDDGFVSKESEWLYLYAQDVLKTISVDYFVFGHRHLPLDLQLEGTTSRYINLGEWFSGNPHFAVFNGKNLTLISYSKREE